MTMFLVRSRVREIVLREMVVKNGKPSRGNMRKVGPVKWEQFEALPGGLQAPGDADVEVKVAHSDADVKAAQADNKRLSDIAEKQNAAGAARRKAKDRDVKAKQVAELRRRDPRAYPDAKADADKLEKAIAAEVAAEKHAAEKDSDGKGKSSK
jgi:hypothetical protein